MAACLSPRHTPNALWEGHACFSFLRAHTLPPRALHTTCHHCHSASYRYSHHHYLYRTADTYHTRCTLHYACGFIQFRTSWLHTHTRTLHALPHAHTHTHCGMLHHHTAAHAHILLHAYLHLPTNLAFTLLPACLRAPQHTLRTAATFALHFHRATRTRAYLYTPPASALPAATHPPAASHTPHLLSPANIRYPLPTVGRDVPVGGRCCQHTACSLYYAARLGSCSRRLDMPPALSATPRLTCRLWDMLNACICGNDAGRTPANINATYSIRHDV